MPHKKQAAIAVSAAAAIAVSFLLAINGTLNRRTALSSAVTQASRARVQSDNDLCHEIRALDAIMVSQLKAARLRALASLPNGHARQHQLQVLDGGIKLLTRHKCKYEGGGP